MRDGKLNFKVESDHSKARNMASFATTIGFLIYWYLMLNISIG